MALTDKNRKLIGFLLTVLGSASTTWLSPENATTIAGILAGAYTVFCGANAYEHKKANGGTPSAPP
jgi:hypothetical protein